MIIAGDIGGTKTNLALFEDKGSTYDPIVLNTYPSRQYEGLAPIVLDFIRENTHLLKHSKISMACFAIAGPVVEGVAKTTNLPWIVDAKELSKVLTIPNVYLLNDLEANAYSVSILPSSGIEELYAGKERKGNRCVVSPGTGLGEAGIYYNENGYHPFACEGGHAEFGPRDEVQIDLCRYLYNRFGHASYERVLSGPGLHNIYDFFKEVLKRPEPDWLREEMEQKDPSVVISTRGLEGKSELCVDALNLFVGILGAESSNVVLKLMALGGVYLGGGIPPKILPKLKEPIFHNAFLDKGRFRSLLAEVPIRVILDDKASLKGAASYCRSRLRITV